MLAPNERMARRQKCRPERALQHKQSTQATLRAPHAKADVVQERSVPQNRANTAIPMEKQSIEKRLQRRITMIVATNCEVGAAKTQPKCGHKTDLIRNCAENWRYQRAMSRASLEDDTGGRWVGQMPEVS